MREGAGGRGGVIEGTHGGSKLGRGDGGGPGNTQGVGWLLQVVIITQHKLFVLCFNCVNT